MKHFSAVIFALGVLYSRLVCATITWGSPNNANNQAARDGFAETIRIANKAVTDLQRADALTDDRIKGAYLPLFGTANKADVIRIFQAVAGIENDATRRVTIYLDDDRMTVNSNPGRHGWVDNAFTNEFGNPTPFGIPLAAPANRNPNTIKPIQYQSYAFLGWNAAPNINFGDQIHISIGNDMFLASNRFDRRSLDTIKADGFNGNNRQQYISYIRPISYAILHELVHAVGGRVSNVQSLNPPAVRITDGPNGDRYGWTRCSALTPAEAVDTADSYAILGTELYLDKVKGATCDWSMGAVNDRTGNPVVPIRNNPKRDSMFAHHNATSLFEPDHSDKGNPDWLEVPKHVSQDHGPKSTGVPWKNIGQKRSLAGRIMVSA